MSITFYIGERREDGHIWPAESCDCSRRWCDDCDAAWERDEKAPEPYSCEICLAEVNMANINALDFMRWVGLDVDHSGHILASELAPKLRRRLWDVERNHDEGIAATSEGRVHSMGRRPGYLRERTEQVLALCERAGDRLVVWA
jgi:hypothetical protein